MKKNSKKFQLARKFLDLLARISALVLGIGIFLRSRLNKLDTLVDDTKVSDSEYGIGLPLKILKEIKKFSDTLPVTIKEMVRSEIYCAHVSSLEEKILTNYNEGKDRDILPLFKHDVARGTSFSIKGKNIPHPLESVKGKEEKVQDAVQALEKEVDESDPRSKQWKTALQSVCSQSTLNILFSVCKTSLGEVMLSRLSWDENSDKEKKSYCLLPDFPSTPPPIELEIIRESRSQNISMVNVTVQGSLDLKCQVTDGHKTGIEDEKEGTVVPNFIKGGLKYSIVFEDDLLVVKGIESTLVAFNDKETMAEDAKVETEEEKLQLHEKDLPTNVEEGFK